MGRAGRDWFREGKFSSGNRGERRSGGTQSRWGARSEEALELLAAVWHRLRASKNPGKRGMRKRGSGRVTPERAARRSCRPGSEDPEEVVRTRTAAAGRVKGRNEPPAYPERAVSARTSQSGEGRDGEFRREHRTAPGPSRGRGMPAGESARPWITWNLFHFAPPRPPVC